MSEALVHMWPNCRQITSNSYKDIIFSQFFGSLPAVIWPFDPTKLISISMNPYTTVTWSEWNSPHWVLRYGVEVFGMHRLTHTQTVTPKYSMPPTPFFRNGGGIRIRLFYFDTKVSRSQQNICISCLRLSAFHSSTVNVLLCVRIWTTNDSVRYKCACT